MLIIEKGGNSFKANLLNGARPPKIAAETKAGITKG